MVLTLPSLLGSTNLLLDHAHSKPSPIPFPRPRRLSTASIGRPNSHKTCATTGNTQAAAAAVSSPQSPSTEEAELPYPGPLTIQRPAPISWDEVILLQGFGWESSKQGGNWYQTVQNKIPELTAAGITHCWLPPPSHSVSKEGYLPTQLYDLSSSYGDHDSLVALNTALVEAGIRPVADIVINHRCADEQDGDGIWNKFRDDIPHPGSRIDWDASAITGNDPDFHGRGHADSGADYGPSPDLDHENEQVRHGIADWLTWLRDYIGFDGWRLDFAKGYAAEAAKWYLEHSVRRPGKDFCVAEYWVDASWNGSFLNYNQNAMRQGLCDWIKAAGGMCAAFDFTTKALLQEAIRRKEYNRLRDAEGKPPGLLGWWPERAVTFIENHDTGSSQRHWPFPSDGVIQGYAYIMTHPGMPCIFWEHFMDEDIRKQVTKLSNIRVQAGIKATSKIEIIKADQDFYLAKINDNVLVKLGPRFDMGNLVPQKSEGWELGASGKDWAVWIK